MMHSRQIADLEWVKSSVSHNRCMQRVQQSEVSLGWCTHVNGAIGYVRVSVLKQLSHALPFFFPFWGKR